MSNRLLLKVAASVNLVFFLFHIPFYWLLDWKHTLSCLSQDNWAIFQCFNIISIGLLFFMSYVVFFNMKDLEKSALGKSLLIFASSFYFFRIVAEFIFFKEPNVVISAVILFLCLIPAVCYIIPAFRQPNN